MSFAHLHVHSHYSLLDGFSNIHKLTKRAKELGMPALALTDHGNMFGVVEFFLAAKAAEVKPIIGIETYIAARGMKDKEAGVDKEAFHLILLAENMAGYANLLQIASASQLEGFYYHPRIDHEFLSAHSEGLIASTACLAGEVPQALMAGQTDKATKLLDYYYGVFGSERFFLELQSHDIPELHKVNKDLLEIGKRYNARYIATNDVHYVNRSDARLQDILLTIQTGSLLTDTSRFKMQGESYYLRTPDEMAALFPENPDALSNTLLIAERCNIDLSSKDYHLPKFEVPEGYTDETYLRELCEKGVIARYGAASTSPKVRERLDYELGVIHSMGFDAYFLIVWDLCRFARENKIWYNARGSAAGSLVAYTLDITLVEPLEQGLIFERFLNPGRVSMPDIDLDFQDDRRSMVMEYCANKFGKDRVAQIITFGTMGARAALRDVGRVMDIPLSEVDRVAKLIPNVGKAMSIADALEQVPELNSIYNETEYFHNLLDTARDMEGVIRNAGTHAAGVIISDIPLVNYTPLHRPTSGSEDSPIKTVAQFEMSIIEYLKLLKVDFLGLSTLTTMQRACDLIEARHGISYNLNNIPLDDPETFQLLSAGHTSGVFQLESNGMTRYLSQMQPRNLANIIAMVALFRPGPMEHIPRYIQRMHGKEKVTFHHELLEPIFSETYGIPIYQEQLMFAVMDIAGYSASEADDLRKAISKKKADELKKHRQRFIDGAQKKGMPEETAILIFADWENFARYGFNKSHAADYGIIAVQTAFLKTHYTAEYMTALLSVTKNDTAKVAEYVLDCRSMDIEVLQPDVNSSNWDFTIEDRVDAKPRIRFGLGAIKNVGSAPVEMIVSARGNKPFKDLNDFARRVDLRQAGRRTLESMIRAGGMDAFGPRQAILDALDRMMTISTSHFRALQTGQMSFFGAVEGIDDEIILSTSITEDTRQKLEWERELIGLYISDHPLGPYMRVMAQRATHLSGQLAEVKQKEFVRVAGMVTNFRDFLTKTGKNMGFVTIQDMQGSIELVVFPKVWDKSVGIIAPDVVLLASGKADLEGKEPKVLVDFLEELSPGEDISVEEAAFPDLPHYETAPTAFTDEEENGLPVEDVDNIFPQFSQASEPPADNQPALEQPPSIAKVAAPAMPVFEEFPAPDDFEDLEPPEVPDPAGFSLQPPPPLYIAPARQEPPPVIEQPVTSPAAPYTRNKYAPGKPLSEPAVIPRKATITLRETNDKPRDVQRVRRVFGLLQSSPGDDRFRFKIFEKGKEYLLEYPNDTTGITQELELNLKKMLGDENVRIEM